MADLLSPLGLARLAADLGPQGADMVSAESAEWRPEPLSATVDCGTCGHRIAFGACCPHCDHGCSNPGDPACPGREP